MMDIVILFNFILFFISISSSNEIKIVRFEQMLSALLNDTSIFCMGSVDECALTHCPLLEKRRSVAEFCLCFRRKGNQSSDGPCVAECRFCDQCRYVRHRVCSVVESLGETLYDGPKMVTRGIQMELGFADPGQNIKATHTIAPFDVVSSNSTTIIPKDSKEKENEHGEDEEALFEEMRKAAKLLTNTAHAHIYMTVIVSLLLAILVGFAIFKLKKRIGYLNI